MCRGSADFHLTMYVYVGFAPLIVSSSIRNGSYTILLSSATPNLISMPHLLPHAVATTHPPNLKLTSRGVCVCALNKGAASTKSSAMEGLKIDPPPPNSRSKGLVVETGGREVQRFDSGLRQVFLTTEAKAVPTTVALGQTEDPWRSFVALILSVGFSRWNPSKIDTS